MDNIEDKFSSEIICFNKFVCRRRIVAALHPLRSLIKYACNALMYFLETAYKLPRSNAIYSDAYTNPSSDAVVK
jgi:hypothetical protein